MEKRKNRVDKFRHNKHQGQQSQLPPCAVFLCMEIAMGEMLLSRDQAAKELDCHPATISKWVKSGALPGMKIGGKTYVNRKAFEAMIAGDTPVSHTTDAPGAITGGKPCRISAQTRLTGGSNLPRREAANKLDALLGRQTNRPQRH
ncbi:MULTISPECIES: helix-turn-helix domain-containing protein [Vreelandella]|uniref:helix-turn-helix domain-containing protein n=1 Tax=Vreelandella TaxID=3137766 RepID=UPI003BF547F2